MGTLHFLVGAWMSGRLAGAYGHALVWALSSVSVAMGGFILAAILYADLNFDIRFGLAASATVLLFVAAGAVVACVALTLRRSSAYRDLETLWTDTIQKIEI